MMLSSLPPAPVRPSASSRARRLSAASLTPPPSRPAASAPLSKPGATRRGIPLFRSSSFPDPIPPRCISRPSSTPIPVRLWTVRFRSCAPFRPCPVRPCAFCASSETRRPPAFVRRSVLNRNISWSTRTSPPFVLTSCSAAAPSWALRRPRDRNSKTITLVLSRPAS